MIQTWCAWLLVHGVDEQNWHDKIHEIIKKAYDQLKHPYRRNSRVIDLARRFGVESDKQKTLQHRYHFQFGITPLIRASNYTLCDSC